MMIKLYTDDGWPNFPKRTAFCPLARLLFYMGRPWYRQDLWSAKARPPDRERISVFAPHTAASGTYLRVTQYVAVVSVE